MLEIKKNDMKQIENEIDKSQISMKITTSLFSSDICDIANVFWFTKFRCLQTLIKKCKNQEKST